MPFVLGALSDLKLPYVEIINPLLSNSVIALTRQLPDALRTRKELFRRFARSLSPEMPFATAVAPQARDDILQSASVVELLLDSLSSHKVLSALPPEFAAYVIGGLAARRPASRRIAVARRLRRTAKAWAPSLAARLRTQATPTPVLDPNRIAFRAYLIERTNQLLQRDAALRLLS